MIDPMNGVEWEPMRARDPRIMKSCKRLLLRLRSRSRCSTAIASPPSRLKPPTETGEREVSQPPGAVLGERSAAASDPDAVVWRLRDDDGDGTTPNDPLKSIRLDSMVQHGAYCWSGARVKGKTMRRCTVWTDTRIRCCLYWHRD
jgi:hypothetical protein